MRRKVRGGVVSEYVRRKHEKDEMEKEGKRTVAASGRFKYVSKLTDRVYRESRSDMEYKFSTGYMVDVVRRMTKNKRKYDIDCIVTGYERKSMESFDTFLFVNGFTCFAVTLVILAVKLLSDVFLSKDTFFCMMSFIIVGAMLTIFAVTSWLKEGILLREAYVKFNDGVIVRLYRW